MGAYTTAEADAEADPYYNYGYSGLGHSSLGYGRSLYGKREAEAEPEAFYGYNNLGYSNIGYAGVTPAIAAPAIAAHTYAAPAVATHAYATPATSAGIAFRGYGTPTPIGQNIPYGYAASGSYVADSIGALHVAKRSADADAEP